MKRIITIALAIALAVSASAQLPTQPSGQWRHSPDKGSLIIIGGGKVGDEIWDEFIERAGGREKAKIVVVTNASADVVEYYSPAIEKAISYVGKNRVTRLHLKDINEANNDKLIKALKEATGVYFTGGRQWRIAEVYLNTKAHQLFNEVLARGGVIAGSSAGASIQGSFLWRGDTSGADILVGDHTQGLGFLKNSAIDQHILVRNRQHDLVDFIKAAPAFIGIGLDESTAIVVEGPSFKVIGKSYVAVHSADQEKFIFLRAGDKYDLENHCRIK